MKMTAPEAFENVVEHLRGVAIEVDDENTFNEFMESLNEWAVDIANKEVDVFTDVGFPYEQGDGEVK